MHATCLHIDHPYISSDNKGAAAEKWEALMKKYNPNFVAAFPQTTPGDVTPNFIKHPKDFLERGESPDDFVNIEKSAEYHVQQAQALFTKALNSPLNIKNIDAGLWYINFAQYPIDPELGGHYSAYPAIGSAFMRGTAEGPGVSWFIEQLAVTLAALHGRVHDKRNHGRKRIIFDCMRRMLLNRPIEELPLPDWADPSFYVIRGAGREHRIPPYSLTPYILPIQILKIGALALLGVPGEMTSHAGKRLRNYVRTELGAVEEEKTIVNSYANAYSGYITTREEYRCQLYEGASTHFGPWTLAAYQTAFRKLAQTLMQPAEKRTVSPAQPLIISRQILERMEHSILVKFRPPIETFLSREKVKKLYKTAHS